MGFLCPTQWGLAPGPLQCEALLTSGLHWDRSRRCARDRTRSLVVALIWCPAVRGRRHQGSDVEHFNPDLPHHRAWLQAVCEHVLLPDPPVTS